LAHTDARSDLYGLGATLYHLLAGRPPASAQDRFLEPDALLPISRINPSVSARTEGAIMGALALHPNDRPESVTAWSRMLLGDEPVTPVAGSLQKDSWGQAVRANWLLLLIAVAALAAAALLTFR